MASHQRNWIFPPFQKKKEEKKEEKRKKGKQFLGSCAAYFVGGLLHIIRQTVFIRCMCAGICVSVLRSNIYNVSVEKPEYIDYVCLFNGALI